MICWLLVFCVVCVILILIFSEIFVMMLFVLIVYIVDDDSGMWMLFVWLFELVGIVFEGFVNVVDFFVCFDVNLFVCFVFDVWMLEKSGFDV